MEIDGGILKAMIKTRNRRLPETGHSSQNSIVCVTFTEDWLVVASPKCKRPGVLA